MKLLRNKWKRLMESMNIPLENRDDFMLFCKKNYKNSSEHDVFITNRTLSKLDLSNVLFCKNVNGKENMAQLKMDIPDFEYYIVSQEKVLSCKLSDEFVHFFENIIKEHGGFVLNRIFCVVVTNKYITCQVSYYPMNVVRYRKLNKIKSILNT